jgi:hypothetical protein
VCLNGIKRSKKAQKLSMQKIADENSVDCISLCKRYHSSGICAGKQAVNGKFSKEVINRLIA